MDRLGIGFPLLEPEEGPLPITKSLQIGVSVMALIISEVGDPEGLQGLGVEGDRTLEITNRENDVVKRRRPPEIFVWRVPLQPLSKFARLGRVSGGEPKGSEVGARSVRLAA